MDAPAEKSSRYLFIEIDRGTETVEPSKRNQKGHKFWRGNSILRKFVVYAHGYRTGAHTELFGIPTFQVLTVTTTPGHVEKMIEVYQKHLAEEVPAIRFLFTDLETLAAHNYDVLAAPVVDGKGKERSLL